jgi:plastocyanin
MFGLVTGCGSDKKADTASGGGVSAAPSDGAPVKVTAGDKSDTEQFLTVDPVTVKAGKVTFTFTNTGTRQHEMIVLKTDDAFDQLKVDEANKVSEDASVGEIPETDKDKIVTKTFDLAAGNYVLVCNIEKHYAQGMRSAFTVTP